jgi:hypothetical protein
MEDWIRWKGGAQPVDELGWAGDGVVVARNFGEFSTT